MGDKNKLLLNTKIKETLSKFRFDVSDIEFNYYIPEIENAYFVLVNNYDESLCIDDIGITYKDVLKNGYQTRWMYILIQTLTTP